MANLINFQLIFEGVVGNGYLGDIAIDDITVKTGSCAGQGRYNTIHLIIHFIDLGTFVQN